MISGAVLAIVGTVADTLLPQVVVVGLMAAVIVAAIAREFGLAHFALPQNARQVPQYLVRRPIAHGSFQFGLELGTGVRTFVTSTAPYVLAVAVFLNGGLVEGILAGLGFGLGRAAVVFLRRLGRGAAAWDALVGRQVQMLSKAATLGVSVFAIIVII